MSDPTPNQSSASSALPRELLDSSACRALLLASREHACPSPSRSVFQLLTATSLFAATLLLSSWLGPWWTLALVPWLAALYVRVFVLQHDCGHRSLFHKRARNDRAGLLLSILTGVPYHAWRTEHHWHHNHQGKLSKRGVDSMNSPMTLDEVPLRPSEARYRIEKVRWYNIFLIGIHSLLLQRKRPSGFFPFRENFTDSVRNKRQMIVGIAYTIALHLALHAIIILTLGWWVSLLLLLPAALLGAGFGTLLFWVQHNFEETYHAEDADWDLANVALHGSSYLRFGPILRWFTADIGLHHVHHLNPRIPNYNLEQARTSIEPLAHVDPLNREDLRRSFTHIFWDPQAMRMRSPEAIDLD